MALCLISREKKKRGKNREKCVFNYGGVDTEEIIYRAGVIIRVGCFAQREKHVKAVLLLQYVFACVFYAFIFLMY